MQELLTRFYTSFQSLDADAMASCYHDDATFEDPAFGQLNAEEVRAMWKMLCERSVDLKIEFEILDADENSGIIRWIPTYTFSQTGKKVVNDIHASFEFKDGLIIKHVDDFNLHKWASQALGFKGWLLGGTGFFKKKLNGQTRKMLLKYMAKAG